MSDTPNPIQQCDREAWDEIAAAKEMLAKNYDSLAEYSHTQRPKWEKRARQVRAGILSPNELETITLMRAFAADAILTHHRQYAMSEATVPLTPKLQDQADLRRMAELFDKSAADFRSRLGDDNEIAKKEKRSAELFRLAAGALDLHWAAEEVFKAGVREGSTTQPDAMSEVVEALEAVLRYHETGGHEGDGSDHAMHRARLALQQIKGGKAG